MTEEQIQRAEKDLLAAYVDEPLELERQIQDTAKVVAGQFLFGPQQGLTKFNFLGNDFVIKAKEAFEHGKRILYFVISNERTRAAAGNRYIPYQMSCEIDNDLSISDNYRAAVEGFLRHVTGNDRAEEIL